MLGAREKPEGWTLEAGCSVCALRFHAQVLASYVDNDQDWCADNPSMRMNKSTQPS